MSEDSGETDLASMTDESEQINAQSHRLAAEQFSIAEKLSQAIICTMDRDTLDITQEEQTCDR